MPHLVAVFLIITLSSIGLPGLNGFVGEFLILLGAFKWNARMAAFAATGVILSATYMLWMFQRVNYGTVTNEKNTRLVDLRPREWVVIVPMIVVAVLMGVFPNIFLKPTGPSVERMLNQVQQGSAPARIEAHAVISRPSTVSSHQSTVISQSRFEAREPRVASREPRVASSKSRAASREPRAAR